MRHHGRLARPLAALAAATLITTAGLGTVTAQRASAAAAAPTNLFTNAGFESTVPKADPPSAADNWTAVKPPPWSGWIYTTADGTMTVDPTTAHSGANSFKLTVPGGTWDRGGLSQSITLPQGQRTLTFSAWIKGQTNAGPGISFIDTPAGGAKATIATIKPTSGWQRYEYTFTVPEGTTQADVGFYFENGTGTYWIDDVGLSPPRTAVSAVNLDKSVYDVTVGGTAQAQAAVEPGDASDPTLTWSSSKPDVATVGADGTITGVAAGGAIITATSNDDPTKTAQAAVLVGKDPSGITTHDESAVAAPDAPASGTISGEDADGVPIAFAILQPPNSGTATVNGNGQWSYTMSPSTTASADRFSVLLTDEKGNAALAVVSLELRASLVLNGGFESATAKGAATASDNWSDWKPATWYGWVIDLNIGTVTIDTTSAHSGSNSAKMTFTGGGRGGISQSVNITPDQKSFVYSAWIKTNGVSSAIDLGATFYDANGTVLSKPVYQKFNGTADWKQFTAKFDVPAGTAKIDVGPYFEQGIGTFWLDDVALYSYTAVQSLTFAQPSYDIATGGSADLGLTVLPQDATDPSVTWTSSDTSVATVDATGHVTGVKAGGAVITAKANDNGRSASTIALVGRSPSGITAADQHVTVTQDAVFSSRLEARDSGDLPIHYALLQAPENGTAQVSADGAWTYVTNGSQDDRFAIVMTDENGSSALAFVTTTVTGVNHAPTFILEGPTKKTPAGSALETERQFGANYARGVTEGEKVTADIDAYDADGDALTFTIAHDAGHGKATTTADGTWTYAAADDYTGIDQFDIKADDGNGGTAVNTVHILVLPTGDKITGMLQQQSPDNAHPRLLASASDFDRLKSILTSDANVAKWYADVKAKADSLLTEPVPDTTIVDGRFITLSRTELDRMTTLGLVYRMTGDARYADRAYTDLQAVMAMPTWDAPGSFLDSSEMITSVAIGFDWMYDHWSADQKATLTGALMTKGLSLYKSYYDSGIGWTTGPGNWTGVCNGGPAVAALAVMDEPGVGGLPLEVFQDAAKSLTIFASLASPDGGYEEGPNYWNYGFKYLTFFLSSADAALGSDFGFFDIPGMQDPADMGEYLTSYQGLFNYSDTASGFLENGGLEVQWFGNKLHRQDYLWFHDWMTQYYGGQALDLIWYDPTDRDPQPPASLDKLFSGVESTTATFRSDWTSDQSTFVGFHGGDNQSGHGDLDMGSFVMDANGVRWAEDLGMDDYNLPGYFDPDTRYTYYKKRAEGHNTLVINPDSGVDQNQLGYTKITNYKSGPDGGFVVGDLTKGYSDDALSVQRGVALLNHRTQVLVQDEVRMKKPSELYWFMHTTAEINVSADGRSAILTRNGQKLMAKIESGDGAKFSVMDATPLPTSPNPTQGDTSIYKKLTIHLQDVTDTTLAVALMPLLPGQNAPVTEPAVVPLSDWALQPSTGVKASSITVDGKAVDGFDPQKLNYTVTLPIGTTTVPKVAATAPSGYAATVEQAAMLPGYAIVTVKSTTDPNDVLFYTVHLDKKYRVGLPDDLAPYPIQAVDASSVPQPENGKENAIDGDLATRWSASGEQWIQFDLGATKSVGNVALAFASGDVRYEVFDISASTDGKTWTTVFSGQSSGTTLDYELYDIPTTDTRYIRVTGYGNSISSWNSITEAKVYPPSKPAVTFESVMQLVDTYVDKPGVADALKATLARAEAANAAGDKAAQADALKAFVNAVNAQQGKALTDEQATQLRQQAAEL